MKALSNACSCCMPRRGFLQKMGGIAAASMLPGTGALARAAKKPAAAAARRIDVHHHFVPPEWLKQARAAGQGGGAPWTLEGTLADMDKGGVAKAVLSQLQPGTWFRDDAQARALAREINDYAARLRADHPQRFGMFTTLPMPDVDGSLKEIEYGLDVLKADGINLFTSYRDRYLGDLGFIPVLQELNRRKCVVYVHPTNPACCNRLVSGVSDSTVEYATDTTRAIASLLFSGAASRFPEIRWIWSHSGGTMPFLYSRFEFQERSMKEKAKQVLPRGPLYELKRFHYETAQGNTRMQLLALTAMIPVSQVLFGSDYPYVPASDCAEGLTKFGFKAAELRAIERDNALRLMPQLKA